MYKFVIRDTVWMQCKCFELESSMIIQLMSHKDWMLWRVSFNIVFVFIETSFSVSSLVCLALNEFSLGIIYYWAVMHVYITSWLGKNSVTIKTSFFPLTSERKQKETFKNQNYHVNFIAFNFSANKNVWSKSIGIEIKTMEKQIR